MPKLRKGNIFERLRQKEVAIIFGHIGLNLMHCTWDAFRKEEPTLKHIRDPFCELPNTPHRISTGQWLRFVPDQDNNGMKERDLEPVLDAALSWAKTEGYRSIITNGVSDTDHGTDTAANRHSDNRRTQFLIRYSKHQEEINSFEIELISLNDAFVRPYL